MDRYAFVDDVFTNTCVEVSGEFEGPDGRLYARNWLELSSPQEKALIGLKRITGPGAVPAGKRVVGRMVAPDAGQPVDQWVLEDIPIAEALAAKCSAIDAERDRLGELPFAWDFGETLALDDEGNEVAAGVRTLQMRNTAANPDQDNWARLQSRATVAKVAGGGAAIMPMRTTDNLNVQTTVDQVLVVTTAMVDRNAAYLFAGAAKKTVARAAETWAAVDAIDVTAGWPE